jgi:hypothetical protein
MGNATRQKIGPITRPRTQTAWWGPFGASWVQSEQTSAPRTRLDLNTPICSMGFYFATDGGGDRKQRNKEAPSRCQRKIGGGTTAGIASDRLSSFTNTSAALSTMRPCLLLVYLRGSEEIIPYPRKSLIGCLLGRVGRGYPGISPQIFSILVFFWLN